MKSGTLRAALETKIAAADISEFVPLIAVEAKFAPVAGLPVEVCLDTCSNLLGGAEHMARMIVDGDPENAERTAYCLSFLLEAAKSMVDTANSRLNRGGRP